MEDQKIIELYFARDEEAIVQTRQSYGDKLRSLAYGILKNNEDAEESESDTYLKTWEAIPPQRPVYFYAFLAKICRNLSLHRITGRNAQKRSAVLVELTKEMEECIPDRAAELDFEALELGEILSAFLRTQPEQNRIIFIRHYMLAEPVRDCARRLGVSRSTVESALFRTRNKLREHLEKEGIRV